MARGGCSLAGHTSTLQTECIFSLSCEMPFDSVALVDPELTMKIRLAQTLQPYSSLCLPGAGHLTAQCLLCLLVCFWRCSGVAPGGPAFPVLTHRRAHTWKGHSPPLTNCSSWETNRVWSGGGGLMTVSSLVLPSPGPPPLLQSVFMLLFRGIWQI